MIGAEERKQALKELSFNRWKALKLFCFCFASFVVGLTALYWTLDYRYAQRIAVEKERLLKDMAALQEHYQFDPVADIYKGVVSYEGRADFDQAHVIAISESSFENKDQMVAVLGQKRELAPSVYEVRFIPRTKESSTAAQKPADNADKVEDKEKD